jgi:hydrogenase expression/formation protein HypE
VGPGIGRDGAVLRVAESSGKTAGPYLAAASDPITFTADRIGWYAVHVNANDVACMGARPRWFLATVLLPEGTTEDRVAEILGDVEEACAQVGAGLVGGHTEITPGLARPIVAGTMLGLTDRWVSAEGARPGDALLLTKGIALEGTAILATDARDRLAGTVPADVLERARRFLRTPGISVVADAFAALDAGQVHALHDPTEGGLATGIAELCEAAGTGVVVELEAIPIFDETRRITEALGLDPMGLLASGALLIATPESDAGAILTALENEGIQGTRIGRLTEPSKGMVAAGRTGRTTPLATFRADELSRAL